MGVHFSFKNCLFSLNLNQSRSHSSWTKCSPLNTKCKHPYSCLYCLNFIISEAEANQIDATTQCRQSFTQKRHTCLWLPTYQRLSQADLVACCLRQAMSMGYPWEEGSGVLLQALPLHSLWRLSYARARAQPARETCDVHKGKDTTYLIIWRSKECSHIFKERFFKWCVRQPHKMLIYSRQCVSNCALEI